MTRPYAELAALPPAAARWVTIRSFVESVGPWADRLATWANALLRELGSRHDDEADAERRSDIDQALEAVEGLLGALRSGGSE